MQDLIVTFGNETSFNEPFDLHKAIEDAVHICHREAFRRSIEFLVRNVSASPKSLVHDPRTIQKAVQNLVAKCMYVIHQYKWIFFSLHQSPSVYFTESGSISISRRMFGEREGLRSPGPTVVEITIADSGCGIEEGKVENTSGDSHKLNPRPRSNAEADMGKLLTYASSQAIDQGYLQL